MTGTIRKVRDYGTIVEVVIGRRRLYGDGNLTRRAIDAVGGVGRRVRFDSDGTLLTFLGEAPR